MSELKVKIKKEIRRTKGFFDIKIRTDRVANYYKGYCSKVP